MDSKLFESNNANYRSSKFHPRFFGDMQTPDTATVRNGHSLRKHGSAGHRGKISAIPKMDEKFFFSNMLRSFLHKNRVLSGKKCRVETVAFKRKTPESRRETTEKISLGLINVPNHFVPHPDFGNNNLWHPCGFPWNCWPSSSDVSPLTSSRLYDTLPSSSSSFPIDSANDGRLFRDVPLGELWLRQPQSSSRLPAMQAEASVSPFCKMDRRLGLFKRNKLGPVHNKFRPHLLSAFSVPSNSKRPQGEESEPKVDTSRPNVHYILRNLRSIFSAECRTAVVDEAVRKEVKSTSSLPDVNQSEFRDNLANKDTQTSPQISPDCRQFSALIGLEIVVDYVKKND